VDRSIVKGAPRIACRARQLEDSGLGRTWTECCGWYAAKEGNMGRWALDSVECPPSQENADGSNMASVRRQWAKALAVTCADAQDAPGAFVMRAEGKMGVFWSQRQSQGYSEGRGRVVWVMRPKRGGFTGGVRVGGRRCAEGEGCEMQDARCRMQDAGLGGRKKQWEV